MPDGQRYIAEEDVMKLIADIENENARRDAERRWLQPGG
jgi:hypothetical protein